LPVLKIQTNETLGEETQHRLMSKLSSLTAEILGKPERYVMVILESGVSMQFAADRAPLIYAELKSIDLPANRTAEISAKVCATLTEILGIPGERIYIEFSNAQRHLWGWNGATF